MRSLVLGATGMLGHALVAEGQRRGLDVVAAGRSGPDHVVDVCNEHELRRAFDQIQPQLVINSVATVDLGACEVHPDCAYAVNARPVALLAELCLEHRARFVQISTDHYFTGDGPRPHDEWAPIRLLNEYARSKLAAEAFALTRPDALVVRTNVTGFRGRKGLSTFIEWAITAIESGQQMTLFDDYYTSTMACSDFSVALFDLVNLEASGLINVAASEVSSKLTFIQKLADRLARPLEDPLIGSVRLLQPRRAESLGLDVRLAERILGRPLPGLDATVARLVGDRPATISTGGR